MLSAVSLWCAQCSLSVACSVQFLCGMLSVVSLWHAQCSFFVVCSVLFVCGMLSAVSLRHAQCSFFVACSVQFLCGVLSAVCLWHAQCSFFAACSVQFLCSFSNMDCCPAKWRCESVCMDMDYSVASVNSYGVAQIAAWSSQNSAFCFRICCCICARPTHGIMGYYFYLFNFYHICINGLTQ